LESAQQPREEGDDMMTDHDTIARMAIRLARGYRQGWAIRIPKTHGVEWNWTTASEYAQVGRSLPTFDRAAGIITYATSKMRWTLSVDGDIEVEIDSQSGLACSIEATRCGGANGAATPCIVARVPDLDGLSSHDLWKVDVAITSLACGPWKPLHNLPPLRVVGDVIRLPSTPCALVYVGDRITARRPDDISSNHPFEEYLAEFGRRGGFRKWERLLVRKVTKEGV
jgi:hypothetical protein